MGFDLKKYKKTKFEHATADVPLPPVFADFFGEGEAPVWKVRGLTGQEIGRVQVAAAKNLNLSAMADAMASGKGKEKVKAFKEMLGVDEEKTPQALAEAFEKIVIGSVEPKVDLENVILLCTRSPTAFYNIHARIKELTDGGMVPGKSKGSTPTQG
ncbi:MAG: hypothetical protein JEZ12_26580 [Desulfobacterium sp.]|nr:hypothetical protein [Desulfobacterium sp.]